MRVTISPVGAVLQTLPRALCLGLLAALMLAPSAWSGSPCANNMLADWRDNGRIDGVYPLPCYQAAIDAIPADILPYADADEVIARALQSASRERGINTPTAPTTPRQPTDGPPSLPPTTPPVNTSATTAVPVPLLVLGGLALALLATGGLGWAARRRRESGSR